MYVFVPHKHTQVNQISIDKTFCEYLVINEKLFELRQQLLSDAIKKERISDALREEWLAADATLKRALIKKSAAECQRAYASQEILDFKNPAGR